MVPPTSSTKHVFAKISPYPSTSSPLWSSAALPESDCLITTRQFKQISKSSRPPRVPLLGVGVMRVMSGLEKALEMRYRGIGAKPYTDVNIQRFNFPQKILDHQAVSASRTSRASGRLKLETARARAARPRTKVINTELRPLQSMSHDL